MSELTYGFTVFWLITVAPALLLSGCAPSGAVCIDQNFVFAEERVLPGMITLSAPAGTKLTLCLP